MTATLYNKYIKTDLPGQDEKGRLWDLLNILRVEALRNTNSVLLFKVYFQITETNKSLIELKAIIGPGDTLAPVLTIMLPFED